ncbi:GNAT family N-acetyltransferase [Amycolatopsis nigrescens]|uniref:GNAT family N-acetyltransferase n=1 Tax=Amycolatopsis nigrescens TaxID=381445 RepID=UPI000377D81D|nr:GNAT family N-acetyltransferase [Amycolatopsis nigrescens]
MSDVVVRPAEPGELAEIGALTVAAYQHDGFVKGAEANYADKLRDAGLRAEHAELLAAVDRDGTVLGSVTVVRPGSEFAEICREGELEFRMLGVAPAARGRGVGEILTRAVVARAVELGCSRVVLSSLDVMHTAHRLYQRLGFTRLPERDWHPAPGVHLLAYQLPVATSQLAAPDGQHG